MLVGISPTERRLEHFMELGQVERLFHFKRARDARFDPENIYLGTDDETVDVEGLRMP